MTGNRNPHHVGCGWARGPHISVKYPRLTEGKDNGSIYNLNKETTGKICKKFLSSMEDALEAYGNFFE